MGRSNFNDLGVINLFLDRTPLDKQQNQNMYICSSSFGCELMFLKFALNVHFVLGA